MGETAFEALRKDSPAQSSDDPVSLGLIRDAMARADSVWIALRPAARSESTDSVTVLVGRFDGFDPKRSGAAPSWQGPMDLGAGVRRWDREGRAPRSAPVRIYARDDRILVFVTSAATDSVERRLERGIADAHVEPRASGLVSLDVRGRGLRTSVITDRAPTLGRLLSRAEHLRAHADLEPGGLRGELELELASAEEALEVASSLGRIASAATEDPGLLGRVLEGTRIEAIGSRVVIRVALGPEIVARLVACAGGSC